MLDNFTNTCEPLEHVHYFNQTFMQCEFVQACSDDDSFIPYMSIIYCDFQDKIPLAIFIFAIWLLVLFIALGVTADDFLCPSLVVITKTLRLSQNIAGVTFLAFGNGAPDIFASLAGIEQAKPNLVLGELFGSGIFVTSVVVGSIFLTQEFKVMERPFLRDITFYLCAAFWCFYLFYSEEINIYHAVGFIALYVVYIITVILSRVIYQKFKAKKPEVIREKNSPPPIPVISIDVVTSPSDSTENSNHHLPQNKSKLSFTVDDDDTQDDGIVLRRFSYRNSIHQLQRKRTLSISHRHRENSIMQIVKSIDLEQEKQRKGDSYPPPLDQQISKNSLVSLVSQASDELKMSPLKEFLYHVSPIDIDSWPEKKWYGKILDILKAPVYFVVTLTVPIVDYENIKSNWCRWLNCIHCITSPLFILFATKYIALTIIDNKLPIAVIVLALGFILSLVVFFTSEHQQAPSYHWVFGYVGFAVSVCWIYLIASEIVSLIKCIGIVFGLSDVLLGLTVLAWGNSIGDFISNLSVARNGYPRMGMSACFGGPLLNLLLGIGIPYTIAFANNSPPIHPEFSILVGVLFGTLCVCLVSTLVTMIVFKFFAKRYYGIYLIALYVVFMVIAILVETKVII